MIINFKNFNAQTVTDENDKEIISFKKSIALPTRVRYSVVNANHENIGSLERIRNNFGLFNLPRIVITVNDDKIEIRKDIVQLRDVYEISGSGFSIVGNLNGPSFNILKNENVLASVNVQNAESGSFYLVDIIDKSKVAQVICILFALSWIL